MWILTREENQYDQYGEYFVYAWNHEPSDAELAHYGATHLGRKNEEETWYNLSKLSEWRLIGEQI